MKNDNYEQDNAFIFMQKNQQFRFLFNPVINLIKKEMEVAG